MVTEAFRLDNGPILPESNSTWAQVAAENREVLEYWKEVKLSGYHPSTPPETGSMDTLDNQWPYSMNSMGASEDGSSQPSLGFLIDIPFSFQLKEDLLGGNLESFELPPITTLDNGGTGQNEKFSILHCDEELPGYITGEDALQMEQELNSSSSIEMQHQQPSEDIGKPQLKRQEASLDPMAQWGS